MNDMNSIIKSMELRRTMLQESGKLNKEALFTAVSGAGIERVVIAFDGEGDSGQLEEPAAYRGDDQVPVPEGKITLHQVQWNSEHLSPQETSILHAIETICYDFLEQDHGGWENNDGAYGEFRLDVVARTVELEFNGRYTGVHTSIHAF